jgi:hypothetical protein
MAARSTIAHGKERNSAAAKAADALTPDEFEDAQ